MSALRAALFLILAGGTTSALGEQIACESQRGGIEACSTVQAGSSVRIVEQLSSTPCIEGRNWGVDMDRNAIWTSGGCHAVFDVQAPRNNDSYSQAQYRSDEPRDEPRYISSQYARADSMRARARDACIGQAASGQGVGPDQIAASDAHWIGRGMLSVSLDTPDGSLTCTVDRDGNVRSIDNR